MKKLLVSVFLAYAALALAQPSISEEKYAATAKQGGTIQEVMFSDMTTLNPVLTSSASEAAILGMTGGGGITYRDWLGNRSYRKEDGSFNLGWAKSIEEVALEQEFIITLNEGWKWSDGTEMTTADVAAAYKIIGDPAVESNGYSCAVVGANEVPVELEILGTYKYRIRLAEPQVNAIANFDCGALPAHIFMPVYEASGAEGIKALWSVDTPVDQLVSGGPYMISEYRPGERVVLKKNPVYSGFAQAHDGSPLPGPDEWIVTIVADRNAQLALCSTGQCSFYYPTTLDEVAAMQNAVSSGVVQGTFLPDIGPGSFTDYLFYNFNNTDPCKAGMFKNTIFRQAINMMIDRQALIDAALGGLGVAGYDYNTSASKPFDAAFLEPFEFNPERGVDMLATLGFTQMGDDGVLVNPATGCRVEFDVQYNDGNNRRAQETLVMQQTAAPYGVKINPKPVSVEEWGDSWSGTEMPRAYDFDAQIGALVGGDVDNPSGTNVFKLASNLNGWNKDKLAAQPWEILIDRMTTQMDGELDLAKRVEIYNDRAVIMREQLPLTPLISPSFHVYTNMGNVWPVEFMDSISIQDPYRPGGSRGELTVP